MHFNKKVIQRAMPIYIGYLFLGLACGINKKVIQRAMPIYIGYLFLGLACGILGQQAHIAPVEAFIMSILAYSGSGQFICIAMLMDNASLFSILVTNFMVSLRYMFFSTAMYPHIKDCSLPYSVIFAQNITDETFAVNLDSFSKDKDWDPQQGLALGFSPCCHVLRYLERLPA